MPLSVPSKRWSAGHFSLVIGTLLLAAGVAEARPEIGDQELDPATGTRIEIHSIFDPVPPTGYAPLRIVATNGGESGVRWTLNVESLANGSFGNESRQTSDFILDIPTRSTQSRLLMVPLGISYASTTFGGDSHQFRISLNAGGLGSREFQDYTQRATNFPAIAISKVLADDALTRLQEAVKKKISSSSSHSSGEDFFGSRFDPDYLPEDWRGLSGFDILMISHAEWQTLKPAVRLAVIQWVRLGGRLHLYMTPGVGAGSLDLPPEVMKDQGSVSLGNVSLLPWTGKDLPADETVNRYWKDPERQKQIVETYASLVSNKPTWGVLSDLGTRSFASWQVVLFLVIFGILVGPVNLFVLAPASRRHRLFVTTPLLSLGASLVMIVILLVQDGVGGIGRRFIAINIEPADASAFVTQEQACRTGILMASSFDMKQQAVLEPLALPDTPWVKLKNTTSRSSLQLYQNGTRHSGAFFQSRAEQGHLLRAAVSTRARLELKTGLPADAAPQLISALGFTASEVFYVDTDGKVWKATGPVATGQVITCTPSDASTLKKWWEVACAKAGETTLNRLKTQVSSPRGVFFATAKAAPGFALDTLESIRWADDQVVVFGTVPKL